MGTTITRCRYCGADIVFIRTRAGRLMPCDATVRTYWQQRGGRVKIVTPDGDVVSAELDGDPEHATGIGYIPHFATCTRYHK